MKKQLSWAEKKKLAIGWFHATFTVVKEFRDTYPYALCPECGKDRFFLDPFRASVKCWKCFHKTYFITFAKEKGYHLDFGMDLDLIEMPKFLTKLKTPTEKVLPPNAVPLTSVSDTHAAIRYLRNRKMTDTAFEFMRLNCYVQDKFELHPVDGEDYHDRIIIPLHDVGGSICSFLARDFTGKDLKHKDFQSIVKAEMPFNIQSVFLNDHIYLTEGSFDSAHWDFEGLATNQINISDWIAQLLLDNVKEITAIPDVGVLKNQTMFQFWKGQLIRQFYGTGMKVNIVELMEIESKMGGGLLLREGEKHDVNSMVDMYGWDYVQAKVNNKVCIVNPVRQHFF